MKRRTIYLLLVLAYSLGLYAQSLQEVAHAFTDKECYLTGERLHVSVAVTDNACHSLDVSKVAYVEISDARHVCAQGMIALEEGRGWADIPLPSTMHSGNYLLSVYTRAMCNDAPSSAYHKIISVINVLHVTHQDEIAFVDDEGSASASKDEVLSEAKVVSVGDMVGIAAPDDALLSTVSLIRTDLMIPDYGAIVPELNMSEEKGTDVNETFLPEVEGHIVKAEAVDGTSVSLSRLVMVGKQTMIFDGQEQPDGSWMYYTNALHGKLPAMICGYDSVGAVVPMRIVSPYARILPRNLPRLMVHCTEEQLRARSMDAQREQVLSDGMAASDTLAHRLDFFSSDPYNFYDLDEWTRLNSVREILAEFVRGVKRQKMKGVGKLYTFDSETNSYSQWPALVLLDGVPVYDIDTFLDYDARLLKYVQIYAERYTFGETVCQGIISFISQKGRLSNYQLDEGQHLVSYDFPQHRPAFVVPEDNTTGTLYWNPSFSVNQSIPAPKAPGDYQLIRQYMDAEGNTHRLVEHWVVRPNE